MVRKVVREREMEKKMGRFFLQLDLYYYPFVFHRAPFNHALQLWH